MAAANKTNADQQKLYYKYGLETSSKDIDKIISLFKNKVYPVVTKKTGLIKLKLDKIKNRVINSPKYKEYIKNNPYSKTDLMIQDSYLGKIDKLSEKVMNYNIILRKMILSLEKFDEKNINTYIEIPITNKDIFSFIIDCNAVKELSKEIFEKNDIYEICDLLNSYIDLIKLFFNCYKFIIINITKGLSCMDALCNDNGINTNFKGLLNTLGGIGGTGDNQTVVTKEIKIVGDFGVTKNIILGSGGFFIFLILILLIVAVKK